MTIDEARKALIVMQEDPTMTTESRYSPSAVNYPDHQLPFVEIHMAYLQKNKAVDPKRYISNLAIMVTKR